MKKFRIIACISDIVFFGIRLPKSLYAVDCINIHRKSQ